MRLDAATLKTERRFDGIYSNKVLPYLTWVGARESLRAQACVLRLFGVALHTFWHGTGETVQQGLCSLNYTDTMLRGLLKSIPEPFELLQLETYGELEAGDSLLLIIRAPVSNGT